MKPLFRKIFIDQIKMYVFIKKTDRFDERNYGLQQKQYAL